MRIIPSKSPEKKQPIRRSSDELKNNKKSLDSINSFSTSTLQTNHRREFGPSKTRNRSKSKSRFEQKLLKGKRDSNPQCPPVKFAGIKIFEEKQEKVEEESTFQYLGKLLTRAKN